MLLLSVTYRGLNLCQPYLRITRMLTSMEGKMLLIISDMFKYFDVLSLLTQTFCLSPSFSQLDSSTWNIDMQELEYNPSKKDLTDAKIHHLLAEELCKPFRRVSIGLNILKFRFFLHSQLGLVFPGL